MGNKIAILYIGTGRYTIFWEDFFKSCEKNFIPDAEKHYFFFTDSEKYTYDDKVTIVPQENLGWPLITCLRYKILNKVKEDLKNYDYAFFFNGNMEFIHKIFAEEFLPTADEGGLIAVPQPYINKHSKSNYEFPFERNPKSTSYIPYGEGKKYYQACIWGGRYQEVTELIDVCETMMNDDLKNNIIPKFHDESVFNKYILNRKFKELSKNYAFSVHGKYFYQLNKNTKIIQRDKAAFKYGGHSYLRGESDTKITRISYVKENILKLLNGKGRN